MKAVSPINIYMTIKEYMAQNAYTQAAFARWLRVRQPSVARWINGTRIPSPAIGRRIVKKTNGAVSFGDIYG